MDGPFNTLINTESFKTFGVFCVPDICRLGKVTKQ